MNLAIIPARGGSKGLPRKNVLPVCGLPLIAWTIQAARSAEKVDRVVVSTDDQEIASVARHYGAEVVFRPSDISGDLASSEEALLHTLNYLEQAEGYHPELLVFLQCTSPLTTSEDIDGTINALVDSKADSALAGTDFHYFLWKQDSQGLACGINHDKSQRKLRQEKAPQFLETGAVYVMKVDGFKQAKHRFFGKTAIHLMPPERCCEIDDPVDMQVADLLLRNNLKTRKGLLLPDKLRALVFDFDGVFTDNRLIVREDGTESVYCSRGDGMGISMLAGMGVKLLVLSTEKNKVVSARCSKLSIECMQGIDNKLQALSEWLKDNNISLDETVFVGNDVNDSACLRAVGCGIVPSDANPSVKPLARIILDHCGGDGAVREVIEMVLEKTV